VGTVQFVNFIIFVQQTHNVRYKKQIIVNTYCAFVG